MFPRFRLTPYEEKHGAVKYYDPNVGRRGVLRRFYNGSLSLSETERLPSFQFAIARRCRVFALTASGDLNHFNIQLADSTGEQYLATPCNLAALLGGYVELPPACLGASNDGATGGYPYPYPIDAASELPYGTYRGHAVSAAPLVFEPNIVLDSNQALSVTGTPMTDWDGVPYRVDIVFHVYEFPTWQDFGPL